jgi:hypothetical protein
MFAEILLSLILLYAFFTAVGGFLFSSVIYMWKGDPVRYWNGGAIQTVGIGFLLSVFAILMILHEKRKLNPE